MANNLQIKRSAFDGATNPTGAQLAYGELGWNNGQNRLWIGRGTDDSSDASPAPYEIVGRQATATAPGAAGFSADNFAISNADYAEDDGSIVTIKDGGVANAELANDSITIGTTSFDLGVTTGTTLAGLTGLDFTNANCIIGASVSDGKTITLGGHANSKVIIAGDLQVSGDTTTVNSTAVTIVDKTFVLGSGATSAEMDDGGVLFSDVATILWDHGTSKLKSSSVITGSYVDTTYSAGNSGLVPAEGTAGHFLRHDGTFGIPAYTTNTNTWNALSTSQAGYVATLPATPGGKFLDAAGNWTVPSYTTNTNTTYTFTIGTGTTKLTLNPDSGSGQDIEIVGAGSVTVARTNASKLTITGASSYSLPTAAAATLGGVKIGDRITIASGVISADVQAGTYSLPISTASALGGVKIGGGITITSGVISADTQAGTYSLPTAAASTLGGVKIGGGITITSGVISADTQAGTYSLPLASASRGGVKVGYTESGKNYPVELDSEKMFVNVPWANTVYSLSLSDINTATSTTGDMLSENSVIDCGSVTWGS